MQPSANCLNLIKQSEGCAKSQGNGSFVAYPDPGTGAAPWTIGWGTTGSDIHPGLVWTQAQCDARLQSDVSNFAAKVAAVIGAAPTTQNQFDALVDFAYNLGVGNLQSSTLLKMHKAGNYAGAAGQFALWNKAGGKILPGLVRRRAAEAALYSAPG